jgi:hypothetical protein
MLLFTANKSRERYISTESHPYLGIFDFWESHHVAAKNMQGYKSVRYRD